MTENYCKIPSACYITEKAAKQIHSNNCSTAAYSAASRESEREDRTVSHLKYATFQDCDFIRAVERVKTT